MSYATLQSVWIHSMGSFYPGVVTKVTPTRVRVEFMSGSGRCHAKTVNPNEPIVPNSLVPVPTMVMPRIDGEPKPAGTRSRR